MITISQDMLTMRENIEQYLTGKKNWVRNNTHNKIVPDFGDEVGGVFMMLNVLCMLQFADDVMRKTPSYLMERYFEKKGLILPLY